METLELVLANGWRVESRRRERGSAMVAVNLCLSLDGCPCACVPGFGRTVPLALHDAVENVAFWLSRQPASHVIFDTYPDLRQLRTSCREGEGIWPRSDR